MGVAHSGLEAYVITDALRGAIYSVLCGLLRAFVQGRVASCLVSGKVRTVANVAVFRHWRL
eukprot:11170026-Lingulodinium_polyedra.AAC.1